MKQIYWIKVNGERYCSFDNIKDAEFMLQYLKSRGTSEELTLEAVPGKDER